MARTSNTADRRAQIVDALIAVMAKQGYDGASIADIARKAGLAPGLVHYHFESKLEILVEAVRVLAATHERALDAALATSDEPAAQLAAFIDVHLGLGAHADPAALACWVLVMAEAIRDKRVRSEVETVLSRQAARVAEILRRGNEAKQLACEDVDASAAAIIATIQGYFSVAATARSVIPPGSAATSVARMVEALVGAPVTLSRDKRRTR